MTTITRQTNAAGDPRITKVTDPAGRQHTYTVDTVKPELTRGYTDPSGAVTTYDTIHPSNSEELFTSASGEQTYVTYEGDYFQRRVKTLTRVTNPTVRTGPTWTFTYDLVNRKTTVTDANSHQTVYTYDRKGRVTSVVDAAGHARASGYDADSNVTSQSGGRSNNTTTSFSSDGRRNPTTRTSPTGAVTTMAYADPNNLFAPSRMTNPQGNATTYTYDAKGNMATPRGCSSPDWRSLPTPRSRSVSTTRADRSCSPSPTMAPR